MTKQESTYNPITYNLIEFKEFDDDILVIHEKYDEHGFPIYKFKDGELNEYIEINIKDISLMDLVLLKNHTEYYKILYIKLWETEVPNFIFQNNTFLDIAIKGGVELINHVYRKI